MPSRTVSERGVLTRIRLRAERDPRRAAWIVLGASVLLFVVFRTFVVKEYFGDLAIYRLEGLQILDGRNLYGPLPGSPSVATYPPFAGLVFCSYAVLSLGLLQVVNFAATLAALVWTSIASCRLAGLEHPAAITAGIAAAAGLLWAEPVFMTFAFGQINLYLLALVLWDFTRAPASRWRGVGVGLAAAIKVTPLVFIAYLVLTRRFAAAIRAVVTFGATIALSLLVSVHDTWKFWTDYLFDVHRVGRLENASNQTVRGWMTRLDHTRVTQPSELVLVALVALFGMTVAVLAYRRLGERWGLTSAALTGLMCSPIAWSHHWVWCVPVMVLLWVEARRMFWFGFAVFFSFCVWWLPHENGEELHFGWWQIALSGWYVVFGLAFLGLAAQRSVIRRSVITRRPAPAIR